MKTSKKGCRELSTGEIVNKKKVKAGALFGKFPNLGKSAQEIKDEMREGWD